MRKDIKAGDLLLSLDGDWQLVLKVDDGGYVQYGFNGKWGTQSLNENKTNMIITIYDGYKFSSRYSIEELSKMFTKIKRLKFIEFEEEDLL